MTTTARGERLLEKIAQRYGITPSGKSWLIAVLDPMHDTSFRVDGYPDTVGSPSVTQLIKQSMPINIGSVATGAWDFQVVQYPILNSINGATTTVTVAGSNGLRPLGPTGYNVGGLVVYQGVSGTSLGPAGTPAAGTTSLTLPANYSNGKYRVLAMGFEIHNTTAELYKNGTTTVWRSPVSDLSTSSLFSVVSTGGVLAGSFQALPFSVPPPIVSTAMLLPGSRQWDAAQGNYSVSTLNDLNIPPTCLNGVQPLLTTPGSPTFYSWAPQPLDGIASYATNTWAQFDMTGATYTGLTAQSTFNLTWNVYVERFPDVSVPDLVVLAQPSPRYDPIALEFYSHISNDVPVGVMAKENGLGDWFMGAVQKASSIIGPALSLSPHPLAKAAGLTMTALSAPSTWNEKEKLTRAVKPSRIPILRQPARAPSQSKLPTVPSVVKTTTTTVKPSRIPVRR